MTTTYHHWKVCAQCHHNCNKNGLCNVHGVCDCLTGWEGNDCARRSCPVGPQISGTPNGTNIAHSNIECSGRGVCDYRYGTCTCYSGYYGNNCAKLKCMNSCSGHGECISMRQAAVRNDGYLFNRTTVYNQWDADVIHGCRCDSGWTGADCSQRDCPSGIDPRLTRFKYETVTLVCDCTNGCLGRFKFQFYGYPTKIWLTQSSSGNDVARALMTAPGILTNIKAHSSSPITAYNSSLSSSESICIHGEVTQTSIQFNRVAGDLPAISFYANVFSSGSVYFETNQILECDCSQYGCNGTFRLSFDGQFTSRLLTWNNRSEIVTALTSLQTILYASISVRISDLDKYPVCVYGEKMNTTIIFTAALGNVPRLGIWSSVVTSHNPSIYSTNNASILRLVTNDGRDDNVKVCNGIGTCDYSRGVCQCPYGWGPDDDIGPCGKLLINSSDSGGLGRCPGVVSPEVGENDEYYDYTSTQNYFTRLYLSINPVYHRNDGYNYTTSTIEYYDWNEYLPSLLQPIKHKVFLNMSSNVSAGPLIHDQARNRLLFIDMNPSNRFIGIANLTQPNEYKIWVSLSYRVFGFAMDPHYNQRKVYWTAPGNDNIADGSIYWTYLDEENPTIYSLVSIIGQAHVVYPMGIAIHVFEERIYWIDKNLTLDLSVLRSCSLDGTDYQQSYILKSTKNHTISTNLTDIKIDFRYNNTAFIIDQSNDPSILALNLNQPVLYPNDTLLYNQFLGFYDSHIVISKFQYDIGLAEYLTIDDNISYILWSDISLKRIGFATYTSDHIHPIDKGTAYQSEHETGKPYYPYYPIGLVLDRGLGPPLWGDYLDCYGHGTCLNYTGKWECQCDVGYFGNCNQRSCPYGPAWFHEPIADNVAHDVFLECSGIGVCDRKRGECVCDQGFEGSACERMACPGKYDSSLTCSNNGRCMSLRDLAYNHENSQGMSSSLSYGTKPYDAKTWDADMIYGCYADSYGYYHESSTGYLGYIKNGEGYNLNQYSCPKTYNLRVIENNIFNSTNGTFAYNLQYLTCSASSGYFQLSFRGQITEFIYHNNTVAYIQSQLEAFTTIGQISVSIEYGGSIYGSVCDTSGETTVIITFITELGDIPTLSVTNHTLVPYDSLSITATTQKNIYLYECGGKGECNRATGFCQCWDHWSTSDGFGNDGIFGDCGSNLIK